MKCVLWALMINTIDVEPNRYTPTIIQVFQIMICRQIMGHLVECTSLLQMVLLALLCFQKSMVMKDLNTLISPLFKHHTFNILG